MRISELPDGGAALATDRVPAVRGGTNVKVGPPAAVGVGPTSHQILDMWTGTQAEYDAISPKIATTLYVIVG
jgi:hypothetical protein